MNTDSMLAAVHAAANEKHFANHGENGADPKDGNQQTENPMSDKTKAAADQLKTETVVDLQAAYPNLVSEISAAAAAGERNRIQGILSLTAIGEEQTALVRAAVADGRSTKADVALQIHEADQATKARHLQNLKGADSEAAVVNAAPNAGGAGSKTSFASNPDGWKAEWNAAAADSEMRRDFPTADHYAQYQQGVADGRIRILKSKSA
jgi:hypothetical protein